MTSFLMLALALIAASTAWLTHPLWRPALASSSRLPMPRSMSPHVQPSGPWVMTAALTGFVLVVAGGGYAWLGASHYVEVGPSTTSASSTGTTTTAARADALQNPSNDAGANNAPSSNTNSSAAAASPADSLSQAEARISAMVDRLAERLKSRPDDADGWQMLGRSYAALGKHPRAIAAFQNAMRMKGDDATLLAEAAFSAAVAHQSINGADSTQLLQRALKIDPNNPKALALAGSLSLERKDYQGAVQYWEQLARIEPPESPFGQQVRQSIAQARDLAGSQAALLPVADAPAANAVPAQTISGTATLAPALRARVSPEDTVFIYARAAEGPRMPLAVLRKQVKDLPLTFTLDDSLAMAPTAKLSSARGNVIVGARISRSGNAVAQPGDLQVQMPNVALGRSGLKLEISEAVKAR